MGSDCLMSLPILFSKNATDFFNLGEGPLTNLIEGKVTEERNGSFIFEGTVLTDDPIYKKIVENNVIRCDAANNLKDQRFRIKRVVDKHDGTAEIYAEHVSYETADYSLKPEISVTSSSAQAALKIWSNNIIGEHPFTTFSDIMTTQSTEWRIDKVENARMALGGVEGSIVSKWGGEYKFDNYDIKLLQKRGATANVLLAYGRNITDFEQERNITDTFTSVYPYAIKREEGENASEELITIPGYIVDSENVANFPSRKAKPVNFTDKFEEDEEITTAKLQQLAEDYIKANQYGIPKVAIKVSFLDLSKTADYAEFAPLENLNLCDDVRVVYPKLGVDTISKVIKTVWNVLEDRYESLEIGQKRVSLSTVINDTQNSVREAEKQINYAIESADGKNTIFHGLYGENGLGEPKAKKVGDMWYKPNGEFTEFYQWNGTIWKLIMSTGELDKVKKEIEAAQEEIKEATKVANDAVAKALANGENITQVEKQLGTVVGDVEGNKSVILQLQDDINLRVEKGDLLSQINLEAGRTLIQSNKILLDAKSVVFGSGSKAFIPSAAIEELVADKITGGELNAANVNVINLNASAISTGTLKGITITGTNLLIDLLRGYMQTFEGSLTTKFQSGQLTFSQTGYDDKILKVRGDGLSIINDGTDDHNGLKIFSAKSSYIDFFPNYNSYDANPKYIRFQAIDNQATNESDRKLFLMNLTHAIHDRLGIQFPAMSSAMEMSGDDEYFFFKHGKIKIYLYQGDPGTYWPEFGVMASATGSGYLPMRASEFIQDSNRDQKEDIKPLGQIGLSTLRKMKVYDYVRKNNKAKQIGLMVDEAPEEITYRKGIDLYSYVSVLTQSIKEQQAQINDLQNRLSMLGGY